jgi:hypothetical protein
VIISTKMKEKEVLKKSFRHTLKKNPIIYRYISLAKQFYNMHFIDELEYTRKKFRNEIGRELDLENPKLYNDKMQWLKFNWKDNLAAKCSDKCLVMDYVRDKGFGDILNDIHGIYDSTHEININDFPEKFVLKANHGSGWNSICSDRNTYNWKREKYKLDTWMKLNYHYKNMEWIYKNITPRILCEKYIEEEEGVPPIDYKIYCFNGKPKFTYTCIERHKGVKFDYYDLNWKNQPVEWGGSCISNRTIPKPVNYEYMLEIARVLSEPFPQSRIDLYEISGKVVFSEITLSPSSGLDRFKDEKDEIRFGEMLDLP